MSTATTPSTDPPCAALLTPLPIEHDSGRIWLPVVSANVEFTLDGFLTTCEELIRFPERTTCVV